jgi:hypothetical protein
MDRKSEELKHVTQIIADFKREVMKAKAGGGGDLHRDAA